MKDFTMEQIKEMYLSSEITTPSKIKDKPDGIVLLDRGGWSNHTLNTYLKLQFGDLDAEHHGYINSPVFLSGFKIDLITKNSEEEYLIQGINPLLIKQKLPIADIDSRKEWKEYADRSGMPMFSRFGQFFGTKSYTNLIRHSISEKLPVRENFSGIILADDFQNNIESLSIEKDEKIVPLYNKVK